MILCSECFDKLAPGQNFSTHPMSACDNCGRKCLGYGGVQLQLDNDPIADFIGAKVLAEWREGESKMRLCLKNRPGWMPKWLHRWLLHQLLSVVAESRILGAARGLKNHELENTAQ